MTLFCVGDSDQLLYRFAGAKPELLTGELEQWLPDIETLKLETNYRSQDEIINKSQQLISYNYTGNGGPYPQEFAKSMTGVKGSGEAIQFDIYQDANEEALAVSQTINELLQAGHNLGDFFIGARTRAQLGYVEGALVRAGIKFINTAGRSFWQSKHIADVIGYLRLAYNTNDREALKQVCNIPSNGHKYTWTDNECKKCKGRGCPKCNRTGFTGPSKFRAGDYCPTRYIGDEFLKKIDYQFNRIDSFLSGAEGWRYKTRDSDYDLYGPTKAQDLQEFVWMLQDILAQAENMGQVIKVIIDDCYEKYLRASDDIGDEGLVNAKLEDLVTVEDLASQFNSPELFLAYVDENIKAAEDAKNKDWEGYVVLSTYHKLKGLERPVVFGLGWCEGENVETGNSVGLLPHTFSLTPPPNFGVLPSGGKSPLEDERCIGYVCITRAESKVFLSGIKNYRTWVMWPSRFINEMELIENEQI